MKFNKIIRLAAYLVLISMLAAGIPSMTSCGENDPPESTDAVTNGTTEDSTDAQSDAVTEIVLFENGISAYTLIRSDYASDYEINAAQTVFRALKELAATENDIPRYITDFIYKGNEETECEILVGETNRSESEELYERLDASDANCFAIEVINKKIVIGATNTVLLNFATEYFVGNCLTADADGAVKLSADFKYMSESITDEPSLVIDRTEGDMTATGKQVLSIARDGDYKIMQGACTDGKYAYFVLENQALTPHLSHIYKVDTETWKIVKKSEPLPIDHGNDLEYNPKLGQILAIHNAPNYTYISYIDPETLTLIRTDSPSLNKYAITYNEARDLYCLGLSGSYNFAMVDADMKLKSTHQGVDTGYVKQGIDSDDSYIYFLQYNKNVIMVYDWEGKYIKEITIKGLDGIEPEAIFHIGSTFYIAFNNSSWTGAVVYEMTMHDE